MKKIRLATRSSPLAMAQAHMAAKYIGSRIPGAEFEIVEVKSPAGNTLKAYSQERTLCEILTKKAAVDIQVITFAVKTYANQKNRNIPKLMELSKVFHVEKKLRPYLEVLL